MEGDFLEAGKLLDTAVYEKLLGGLAAEQPDGVYSAGEVIGTEMNDLKVWFGARGEDSLCSQIGQYCGG